jgi:hypothetical protein
MALTSNQTTNVKLGVCKVYLGGMDLGFTKGGVEVEVTTDSYAVTVDQLGSTPISEYINGRNCMVRCPLAETTVDHLIAIMPGSTKVGTGAAAYAEVATGVGTDLRGQAKVLRLHPVGLPESNKAEDFVIPLAATTGALTFAYKLDEERIFNVEFKAYADNTGRLFYVGPVNINDATGVVTTP